MHFIQNMKSSTSEPKLLHSWNSHEDHLNLILESTQIRSVELDLILNFVMHFIEAIGFNTFNTFWCLNWT